MAGPCERNERPHRPATIVHAFYAYTDAPTGRLPAEQREHVLGLCVGDGQYAVAGLHENL